MTFGTLSETEISAHFLLHHRGLTPAVWQPWGPNTNIPVGGLQWDLDTNRTQSNQQSHADRSQVGGTSLMELSDMLFQENHSIR